jgi:hypothetical protein
VRPALLRDIASVMQAIHVANSRHRYEEAREKGMVSIFGVNPINPRIITITTFIGHNLLARIDPGCFSIGSRHRAREFLMTSQDVLTFRNNAVRRTV